jgi:AAA+ superfamily predicted ATPase
MISAIVSDGEQTLANGLEKIQLNDFLTSAVSTGKITDLVLADEPILALNRVLEEQRQAVKLRAQGLRPQQRLLLTGPPETGKGMTARVLAGELNLPLLTIHLDEVMVHFSASPAGQLLHFFRQLTEATGVYFVDEAEFSVGAPVSMGDASYNEARRILGALLHFFASHPTDSLLVASTNSAQLLDKFFFHYFDVVSHYNMPGPEQIKRLIQNRLNFLRLPDIAWGEVIAAAEGLSHGDVLEAVERTGKDAILNADEIVTTWGLVDALRVYSRKIEY